MTCRPDSLDGRVEAWVSPDAAQVGSGTARLMSRLTLSDEELLSSSQEPLDEAENEELGLKPPSQAAVPG